MSDARRRLHQQALDIRMRTAQHLPAPLLLARAVLARDQAEIARHRRRPTEARRVIQRSDIRAGGNRPNGWQRRQTAADEVLDHVGGKCLIRLGEFLVQYFDDTSKWRERLGYRRGKVEFGDSAQEAV